MKTKDFISAMRELGFNIRENHVETVITDVRDYEVCSVSKLNCFSINTRGSVFLNLGSDVKEDLLTHLYEYAKTPLEEREEEKKYYVKLNNPILNELADDGSHFLNQGLSTKHFLADKDQENGYQTQFTNKEINEFPDEVKALLPLCEKIEVSP